MAGPGGPTVVEDTAIGRDGPTVVRVMEIAPAGPIGVVRLAGMPEAATAAMLEAGSVATSAVDSTVAEASTAVVDSMAAVVATEADTAKSYRLAWEHYERLATRVVSRFPFGGRISATSDQEGGRGD